ncbi:MAG: hypothetical protein ABJB78_02900 [Betaproteobacteria bacterium]
MKPNGTPDDLAHSIEQVERRIELRRARLARHAQELRDTAERKAKPLALAGVAAVAVAGFLIGNAPARSSRRGVGSVVAKTGALAALAGALRGAIAVGTNPLVRSAWNNYMRKRV